MSLGRKVTLNTGYQIPQLGYGTWQAAPGEVGRGVLEALKAGYRHLDLATIYQNQPEVAAGLKQAYREIPGLKREDLFITSKLWNNQHRPDLVPGALDSCLAELELDYLDLYLIHWPVTFQHRGDTLNPVDEKSKNPGGDVAIDDSVSLSDTWKAMTQLPKSKVRSVGVSNHTPQHIEALIKATGIVPAVNQVERHPLLQTPKLVEYCLQMGIHVTAYSAFGNNVIGVPLLVTRPEVKQIAERLTKESGSEVTPAQVLLSWAQVGGHSVIPKSVTPHRIRENFKEVQLSQKDVETLNAMGKVPRRFNNPYPTYKPRWDVNIFDEPSEKPASRRVKL